MRPSEGERSFLIAASNASAVSNLYDVNALLDNSIEDHGAGRFVPIVRPLAPTPGPASRRYSYRHSPVRESTVELTMVRNGSENLPCQVERIIANGC